MAFNPEPILDPPRLPDEGGEKTPPQTAQQQQADSQQQDAQATPQDSLPNVQELIQRFGNDPEQLAAALAEREAVQAQSQNTDQYVTREDLEAMRSEIQNRQTETTQPDTETRIKSLAEDLNRKAGEGENVIPDLVRGITEILREEQSFTAQQQRKQHETVQKVRDELAREFEDVNTLTPHAEKIYRDSPWLVKMDGSEAELRKSLRNLYRLAQIEAGGSTPPRRAPVTLDSGANRLARTSSEQTRQTERYRELKQKAMASGRDSDWQAVAEEILTRS
jgi:hypothetical protein